MASIKIVVAQSAPSIRISTGGGTGITQADLDAKQDRRSERLTPLVNPVSVGEFGGGNGRDIQVVATTYFIKDSGNFSAALEKFENIALSAGGTSRYIGTYGTTDNTVIKLEGAAGAVAVPPATPENTVLIGDYVLVGDASITVIPSRSGYPISFSAYYGGFNPLDNTTYALGIANPAGPQPGNREIMLIPLPGGVLKSVMIQCSSSVAGSAATDLTTFNFVLIDSTTLPLTIGAASESGVISRTLIASVNINNSYSIVPMNIETIAGQRARIEMVNPAYTSNPTNTRCNMTLFFELT